MKKSRVLIIGSGIAGVSLALKLSDYAEVTLVCKTSDPMEGATRYAQGGIASVWSRKDTFEEHISDTLDAGVGLCHREIVDLCIKEGPKRIRELIELGVPFTRRNPHSGDFDLHREGGHRKRRVLHADDLTGLAMISTLLEKVRLKSNIRVLSHHIAIDLITEDRLLRKWKRKGRCLGAYALDVESGQVKLLSSDVTILATGGAGKVYLYTSNPDTATGDGIAMAYRARARVANLEFMQFHPTCLYHAEAKNFLISEALRGEGAVLRTLSGKDFMKDHHEMGSLAPRDIVARAIDVEMKKTGDRHVLLDASHLPADQIRRGFPNIYESCLRYGMDITREAIPVVPAAHYMCGGVVVDRYGRTSIEGLYAIGETSFTGFHGANRLASNSLLEAVVFAHQVGEHIPQFLENSGGTIENSRVVPEWDSGIAVKLEEKIDIAALWLEIRTLMWNYVGIVRSNRRLEKAKKRLLMLRSEIEEYYRNYLLTKDLVELRNLVTISELIVQCAQMRKESRGLHFTVDYPERSDQFFSNDTII